LAFWFQPNWWLYPPVYEGTIEYYLMAEFIVPGAPGDPIPNLHRNLDPSVTMPHRLHFSEVSLPDVWIENCFAEELHELVLENVKKLDRDKNSNQRSKIKYNVITWIKKRYIIEQLYHGKCVGCGRIKIMDNLPAYDFHHKNSKLEKTSGSIWRRILTKQVTTIIELLIKEECVALCSNCHRLVHATHFNSNVDNILDGQFSKVAKISYSNITSNIRKFKFIQTDVVDPLKKKIKYGEIWKKYLILIYQYCQEKKSNEFNSIELVDQFNITQSMINRILSKLKINRLIIVQSEKKPLRDKRYIIGQIPRTYKITEVGEKMAKSLI